MRLRMRKPSTLAMLALAAVACALTASHPVWLDISVLTGILSLISLSAGLSYGQAGMLSIVETSTSAGVFHKNVRVLLSTQSGGDGECSSLHLDEPFLPSLIGRASAALVSRA